MACCEIDHSQQSNDRNLGHEYIVISSFLYDVRARVHEARYFSWQRLKSRDTRLMGDGVVLSETLACNLAIKCRQIPENNWLQNVDSVGQNDIRAFTGIQALKFAFSPGIGTCLQLFHGPEIIALRRMSRVMGETENRSYL